MRTMLRFDHDAIIDELPYALIGETTSRAIWNTGKRKRLWNKMFTRSEKRTCAKIISQSQKWLLTTGVPNEVRMCGRTRMLWNKLADFCYKL